MKELIFRVLRKNRKVYYLVHNFYDFVRPVYLRVFRKLNIGFKLDKSVRNVSKNMKNSDCEDIVFLKGDPYYVIDSKLFKYMPFGIDDSASMFRDKRELILKKVILDNLKENSIFIDIGANIGFFTILVSNKITKGKIYAFEPVKKTYSLLKHNIQINKIEKIVNASKVAVSDSNGWTYMTTNKSGRNHISSKKLQTEKVKTIKLDTFVKDKKIKKVDVIKCDVEGAELFVLKGAISTLKSSKPTLLIEIQENWTGRFDYSPEEVFSLLKKVGYDYEIATDEGLINGSRYKNIKKDLTTSNNFVFKGRKK